MKTFEDFIEWVKTTPEDKELFTIRVKTYYVCVEEDKDRLKYKIGSTNNIRYQPMWSVKQIFEKFDEHRETKIGFYNKRNNPPYTLSASYIVPLLKQFFKEKGK